MKKGAFFLDEIGNFHYLPGTTINVKIEQGICEKVFTPMFLSGGLVLSQVTQITGLEGYIIQNWIKRRYLPGPVAKKYTYKQLCRILNINVLKDSFSLEQTAKILSYTNNAFTSDESGKSVDDIMLYSCFVDCLAKIRSEDVDPEVIKEVSEKYNNSIRLTNVLKIMITSYEALLMKNKAIRLYSALDFK